MLERIAVRPAGLGAAVTMLGYLLVTGTLVPATADLLVRGGALLASAVIIGATLLAALLGGWVTVLRLRRHRRYASRGSAVPTLVVMSVLATLVLAVMGSAATAAAGLSLDLSGAAALLVTMVLGALPAVWLVRPAAEGYAYVRPRALRRDAGQGSVEALGITAVAVVLVASLVVAIVPGGRWLKDELRVQLCRLITLGQGDCGSAALPVADERPEPEHACVRNDTGDDRAMSVSVMWVQAEGGALIRVEELSDKTFRVSREGSGGLGGQVDTGAGITLTVDGKTVGGEVQASASALLTGGVGATWVVDKDEKDRLVSYLKDERNWDSVKSVLSTGGPVGQVAGWIGDAGRSMWNWATDAYSPPAPQEVYGYAGLEAGANAAVTGLVQNAEASAGASTVLGMRTDTKTGATTIYYEGQLDLSAGYQSHLEGSEVGASGTVRPLVAVTYDPEGMPLNVQVQAVAAGEAKLVVGQMFGDDLVNQTPSGGFIFDARVSVTGEETRDIALGLLQASGIAVNTPAGRFDGASDAVGTFMDAARERGTLTRQTINIDGTTDLGISANGKIAGVGLGGSFANSTETITTTDADYWDGSRWRTWESCMS